ncbi:MAG TPA: hypothetical protein VIV55_10230 [Flavobacterium sp.]
METENNKLIAEFMGANGSHNYFGPGDTLFDSDWNWLMCVVDKIDSLEVKTNSDKLGVDTFGIEINKTRCDITHYGDITNHLLQGEGKTRIETTYDAVVKFINWYNKYIKQNGYDRE